MRVYLIDGYSLLYRAFYALPQSISTSSGLPTNALYGFTSMLLKLLDTEEEVGIGVVWDGGMPAFRHLARHGGKGVVGLEAFGPDGRDVHGARISSMWSSCDLSSSGMAERCALYSGKISSLNSGIPPSHTTPRPTSSSVSSSLSNMLVKP